MIDILEPDSTEGELGDGLQGQCSKECLLTGDLSPLIYSVNKFVTNKSKLPQDGAQVFPYIG